MLTYFLPSAGLASRVLALKPTGLLFAADDTGGKQFVFGKAEFSAVFQTVGPSGRSHTDFELLYHIRGYPAVAQVISRRTAGIFGEQTAEKFTEFGIYSEQPFPFTLFCTLLRIELFFRDDDPAPGGKDLGGIDKIHIFLVHKKAENISTLTAAETMITLPRHIYMERRSFFLMKRTQAFEARSA